ncbi:ABC transporter substrate-binding protein [Rhodobacteraceae bacterium F11138]|nr:ABC transporter substrate-binding protein [Rhodobacteraceae bacterium F11138]
MKTRTLAFSLAALITSALPAASITVSSAAGDVTLEHPPERIAVYDVAALDTLQAMDIPVGARVQKVYVDYLTDQQDDAALVGTLFEPDFEALHVYDPDLIIVGARSATKAKDLSRIAPVMETVFGGQDLVAQVDKSLDTFGIMFDREDRAQKLKQDLDTRLQSARDAVRDKGTALIVMTNGPKISAYGPNSRFGWLHDELGIPAAVPDIADSSHGEAVSFEYILHANPDWLIVLDRVAAIGQDGQMAQEVLDNDIVRETQAWQDGHIVYLDPATLYIATGGYQATSNLLDQITAAFK